MNKKFHTEGCQSEVVRLSNHGFKRNEVEYSDPPKAEKRESTPQARAWVDENYVKDQKNMEGCPSGF